MQTSVRYLITRPHAASSAYVVNGIEPVAIWDFATGQTPSGFAISRAASAFGYDVAGRYVAYPANSLRFDARRSVRTALLEAGATNLLSRAITSITTGWTQNGASGSDLALNALALFPGVAVTSNGAIWHRLTHTDEPAVTNGVSYHLRVFFKFGTSGKILVTLRNNAASIENRFMVSASGDISLVSGAFSNITLTALGVDGVHRLDANFVPGYSGNVNVGLGPGSATSGQSVIVLGAQFETGTMGSSFINTTGAVATRPADSVTWAAPTGSFDLRIVDGAGAATDSHSVTVGAGWTPQASPFSPARVLLYPVGTL
jgi:hypothetical protein